MQPRLVIAASAALALATWHAAIARADAADDQYRVAAANYQQGRYRLAVEEFRAFLADHADDARGERARFFLAESLMQLADYDAAAKLFEEIGPSADARLSARAAFRAAEACYLAGRLDDAESRLAAFTTSHPEERLNEYALVYLGEIALAHEKPDKARECFDQCVDRFPQGALIEDCRLGVARVCQHQGKLTEARRRYSELVAADGPRAADAQYRLAMLEYAAGQHAEAAAAFAVVERRAAGTPLAGKARLGRAKALYNARDFAEAQAALEPLVTPDALGQEAGYWLGLCLKAQRKWDRAAEVLGETAAAATQPQRKAESLRHAGEALLHAHRLDDALVAFGRAAAERPTVDIRCACLLGKMQVLERQGKHAEVEQLAEEIKGLATTDDELSGVADRIVARGLLARGEHSRAVVLLQARILNQRAARDEAETRTLLARAYLEDKRPELALRTIEPVVTVEGPARNDARRLQAAALAALGRHIEAVAPLSACLADLRDDDVSRASVLAELAVCYAGDKQFDKARATYAQLRDARPNRKLLSTTSELLAAAALSAGEAGWAAELFAAVAADANSAESTARALLGLARAQWKAGRNDEAANALSRVIEKHAGTPWAAEAAIVRGEMLEQLGQPDAALAMYERAAGQDTDVDHAAEGLLRIARLHASQERWDKAAAAYERLAAQRQDAADEDSVLYEWAWAARSAGDHERAVVLFERLRASHPDSRFSADAAYRLAEEAARTGAYDHATELLAALAKRDVPSDVRQHALYLAGQVAVAREQWPDVASPLVELVEEFPTSALAGAARFWIAEAAYRQGRYQEAAQGLESLAKSGEVDSAQSWAAMIPLRRAQILVQQARWSEAAELAGRIATDYPNFPQQYEVDYVIGRAQAARADFEEARKTYRKVINSATGGKTETAAMAQWMIGETYMHQKNYAAALREYVRVEILYAYPKWQAAALLQAGKCHELLKQPVEAAAAYGRLLERYPDTTFHEEAAARLDRLRR
ncbi:MAG: tetratricopeptide repeat protein [Planctomycetia bacterium]|nr:tetratricopeptide repeat protein [Planctomycetia bacterium]